MKIDRIRIENLASLRGPQEALELSTGELADAGLVAITGATGAGKSTILDAVCLALFDRTPRLHGRGRDPRELLSRGTGEARAVIDLTLDDGRQWTAEWSVHRARNRPEGTLQASRQRILDGATGEVLADQKKKVKELVESTLGLSFDQFTGVILLAQGQFAKFLESSDADRSELLERLTGTEIYSQLGKAAFERHRDLKQRTRLEEERRSELKVLTDHERQAKEQQQDELEPHLARVHQQLQQYEQQGRWLEGQDRLLERLRLSREQMAAVNRRQEEADPERVRLGLAETATSLVAPLRRVDDARSRLVDAGREHQKTESEVDRRAAGARQAWDHLQQVLKSLDLEVERAEEAVDEMSAFAAADVEELGTIRAALQQAAARRDEAQRRQKEAEQAAIGLEKHHQQLELSSRQSSEAQSTLDRLHERMAELLQRQSRLLGGLSLQRLGTDQLLLKQAIEVRKDLDLQDPEPLAIQVADLTVDLQRCDAETKASKALEEGARKDLNRHEKLLQLAIEGAKVASHRHLLRDGDPCPLCGALDHPLAAEDGDSGERDALREAHERRAALKSELDRAENQWQESENRRQSLAQELTRREEQAQEAQRRFEDLRSRWLELRLQLNQLPVDAMEVTAGDLLAQWEEGQQRLQTFQAMNQEKEHLQESLDKADRQSQQLSQAGALAEERVQQGQRLLASARTAADQAAEAASQAEESFRVRASSLARACGLDPSLEENALLQLLTDGRARLQKARDRQRRSNEWQASYGHRGRRLLDENPWPATPTPGTDTQDAPPVIQTEGTIDVESLRRAVDDADQRLGHFRLAQDRHKRAQQELASAEQWQREGRDELDRMLKESPFDSIQALRDSLLDGEALTRLRQKLQRLRLEEEARRAELRRAEDDLQEHRQSGKNLGLDPAAEPEPLRLEVENHLRRLRDRRDQLEQSKTELRLELAKDSEIRRQIQQLDKKMAGLMTELDRAGRLAHLIGQSDGGKFRRFAQQLNLRQLLELANLRLQHLAPRYALASITGSLELEVIDREMADERRPVSTLSGGESFLVSLSLALALADLRRGRLKLGTLFLDEGFGSLDQDTLDTALSTLEQLQADQETQILIISHVGALQERIPHRIEVQKRGGGRSRLRLRVGDSSEI